MSHSKSDTCIKNNPHHSFSISLATALKSSDQAIFLHHISYWLDYNERMERNFHEGRYWTFQTLNELHAHFPYWSIDQLRTIIKKLTDKGILIKGNFNENKYDHTVWYAIDWNKIPKSICEKSQIDKSEIPDRLGKNPEPIPHNKPNNKERDIERKPYGKYVKFSDEEYQNLCKKETKEKVDEIIEEINDHCTNNRPKGYDDYVAAFRTFLRNQNKTQGKNHANRNENKRKSCKRKTENPSGVFINGIRIE